MIMDNCWRISSVSIKPEMVECEELMFDGDHYDADGVVIDKETHFEYETRAWQSLAKRANEMRSLEAKNVRLKTQLLDEAKRHFHDAAMKADSIELGYREFLSLYKKDDACAYWVMDGRAIHSIDKATVLVSCETYGEALENVHNYGNDTCIVKSDADEERVVFILGIGRIEVLKKGE